MESGEQGQRSGDLACRGPSQGVGKEGPEEEGVREAGQQTGPGPSAAKVGTLSPRPVWLSG